ncbi:hypothetical protein P171DRAFT_284699 [Karstenula rhodostoma CBS 690.94]|uniref:Uncharacterized protein n=1 Tax=Karstenula rhodostoma CBS 690.94 TaxID=1392251 RepID=A0A9P4UCY3_9PLEO|nr:hypothetical protein P171DRAFT_284699 [Karstenula rhodostoma CBS 690.94]
MQIDLHIAVAPRVGTPNPASAPRTHHRRQHKCRALHRRASTLLNGKRSTSPTFKHHRPRRPISPERGGTPDVPKQPQPDSTPGPEDRLTVAHTLPRDLCYDGPPQEDAQRFETLRAPMAEPDGPRKAAIQPDNGVANPAPAVQPSQRDAQSCGQDRLKPLVCCLCLVSLASLWYIGSTDHEAS